MKEILKGVICKGEADGPVTQEERSFEEEESGLQGGEKPKARWLYLAINRLDDICQENRETYCTGPKLKLEIRK